MIGENLLRFRKDLEVAVIDLETEGLHVGRSRPWQCAIVLFKGDQVVEKHNLFPLWKDLNVSPGAAIATRFDHGQYLSVATDPLECLKTLRHYLHNPNYIKVMHNGLGYDNMVEATWARELGQRVDYSWLPQLVDTNCIAKAMKLGVKPDTSSPQDFLAHQFKLSEVRVKGMKTNLTALGKEFKIEYDYATLHEGMNDVFLNKLVFDKLKWTVEF